MPDWLKNCVPCFTPEQNSDRMNIGEASTSRGDETGPSSNRDEEEDPKGGNDDPLFWSRDLDRHFAGEYSFAVIQGNKNIEDYSQVEVGSQCTFIGVYDGHGGHQAAEYVRENLFGDFMSRVRQNQTISGDVLTEALFITEEAFLTYVSVLFESQPLLAGAGTCCLVGVIWEGTLYVANVGDCRAIIGSLDGSNQMVVDQLTTDDNLRFPEVRLPLQDLHEDDPDFIIFDRNAWRIKGRLQVSKSIGDAYLKFEQFNLDEHSEFRLNNPLNGPALSAEPLIITRPIQAQDQFVIFASDGLWDVMSNKEAAFIVEKYPRKGIAARLIRTALEIKAQDHLTTYAGLQRANVENGDRRFFHDDITVVVIFFDRQTVIEKVVSPMSVKGSMSTVGVTDFSALEEIRR